MPNIISVNVMYNPDDVEINVYDIEDVAYNLEQGIEFTANLSVKNNGSGPIEHIKARFYLKNKNGDIVYERSETLKAAFNDPEYVFD